MFVVSVYSRICFCVCFRCFNACLLFSVLNTTDLTEHRRRESVCDRHRGHTESRVSHQLFSFSTFFDLLCGLRHFLSSVPDTAGSSSGRRAWPHRSPCWLKGWVVRTASHLQFTASANITVTSVVTCQQTDKPSAFTHVKFCLFVVFMSRLRPLLSLWTSFLSS